MILLDTDTVTHFSYGNENVRRKIEEVNDEELGIAIITRNEILRGGLKAC
jgi:tRNA(fMet)-specific endonuclease VapC